MARQTYLAFLLRLWRVDSAGQPAWRASLEDAHSGQRHGFGDLPALQEFLQALLDPCPPEGAAADPAGAPGVAARLPGAEK
jgi:hypothetical protein